MTPAEANAHCAHEMLPLVYEHLRAVARQKLSLERAAGAGHTLQPTAIVHEAFARLAKDSSARWQERRQFFLDAAREIEHVLVDHARIKFAKKRGGDPSAGGRVRIPIDVVQLAEPENSASSVALHEAILRLEEEDIQAASVVRLRFYAGLTSAEVALALGVSERTVVREWTYARAYLAQELGDGAGRDDRGCT